VTLKEKRNLKTRKSRCQISDQIQNRILVKPRLILPSQDQVSQNWRNRAAQATRLVKGRNQKTVQEQIPITSKTQYESQLKSVAEEHTSYSVFNKLGPKVRSENLIISVNNQSRKKRRVVKYVGDLERHFSAYMVIASFEENKESQVHTSVNVVTSKDPQNPEDPSLAKSDQYDKYW
jgi:hypothetical protein